MPLIRITPIRTISTATLDDEKELLKTLFGRYRDKQSSPEEEQRLLDAIRSGQYQALFEGLIDDSFRDERPLDDAGEQRLQEVVREVFQAVQHGKNQVLVHEMAIGWKFNIRRWLSTVAAAVLLLGACYFIWQQFIAEIQVRTIRTAYGEKKQIVLPDSSVVWLNAGTEISYPERFKGGQRIVNLKNGQAYFDISRNSDKAFIVKALGMDVRVLGTAFEVKSFADQQEASVSVGSGEVAVQVTGKQASRPLLPQQQMVYDHQTGEVKRLAIDSNYVAAWRNNRLAFYNERLEDVLAGLERQYNIPIRLVNKRLAGQRITMQLGQDKLTEVLSALSFTVNFNFKQHEKEITIE